MIEIKKESREFTKVERYLMTVSPNIKSIKDVPDGTSIKVDGYLMFDDFKKDGEVCTITSIITPEKVVYSAQSATFRNSLEDIFEVMDGCPFPILKISGTTKAGRDYVNCVLDVENI